VRYKQATTGSSLIYHRNCWEDPLVYLNSKSLFATTSWGVSASPFFGGALSNTFFRKHIQLIKFSFCTMKPKKFLLRLFQLLVNPFVKNLYQIGPKLLLKSVMVVMVPPRLSPSGNLELSRTWDYCFHNNNQAFWSKEKRLKKEKKTLTKKAIKRRNRRSSF
jgi:hypothetical protein